MPFVKELIIHGFKSFAKETRIPFKNTMNVIVGPNGSGKSNVTDAICFVLGRRGSKSMRAKKLSNLIFAGTQKYKPASEASVELLFDNSDGGFSFNEKEVSIKRILRKNGQGIYKINGDVKTLQEVLELMAQAGIDPNGFNIVMQGEIDSFVKMTPEERREVIEEIAGISVYEIRKQHSLHELDRTEEKLKEVSSVLRDRRAYLKNLEDERRQAMHYKKLQEEIKNLKASILHKTISEKQGKIDEINAIIKKEQGEIEKINAFIEKDSREIAAFNEKIRNISENIQKSSGLEQEKINMEISDLRADIAGLEMKKTTSETNIEEMKIRMTDIEEKITSLEQEIAEISKSKGKAKMGFAKDEIESKKKQLEEIEEKRRKFYSVKFEVSSIFSRIEDKKRQLQKTKNNSDIVLERIRDIEANLHMKDSLEQHREQVIKLRASLDEMKKEVFNLSSGRDSKEKEITILETKMKEFDKVENQISSLDVCPLCKTKMTKEHVSSVIKETDEHKKKHSQEISEISAFLADIIEKLKKSSLEIEKIEEEMRIRSQDVLRLELMSERKKSLKELTDEQKMFESEIEELDKKRTNSEKQLILLKTSEDGYDSLRLEIQELERRSDKDVDSNVIAKQMDLDRARLGLRLILREIEDKSSDVAEILEELEKKQALFDEKNDKDRMIKERFKKTLEEKSGYQEKIRFYELDIISKQNNKRTSEDKFNNFKIERAQVQAMKDTTEADAATEELRGAVIMRIGIEEARKKLEETQRIVSSIGTVNMRSLEVYEGVRQEYEKVQEKADTLIKEKEEILLVIEDIDKKKKRVFMQTLNDINALFSRNFSELSTKGIASLIPALKGEGEEVKDISKEGIEMVIKVGKGKYFDTHSLSGGEKSLISLSLIFAIQEHKPYCFYIFDEIDAALDKHNSERLASLFKRYMNKGQYIIITHNDSLTADAPTVYGVVMQDKISSVLSMEI